MTFRRSCELCGRECRTKYLCAKCNGYRLYSEESQGRKTGALGRFAYTPIPHEDEFTPQSDHDYHGDTFRDDI